MLTEQLPRVEVSRLMSVSGAGDSSDPSPGVDFKPRNEDRISVSEVPMLTAANKAASPLVIIAWVLYLALPFSLHPSWVILPFAIGFGLAVTVTASTFKKYL